MAEVPIEHIALKGVNLGILDDREMRVKDHKCIFMCVENDPRDALEIPLLRFVGITLQSIYGRKGCLCCFMPVVTARDQRLDCRPQDLSN